MQPTEILLYRVLEADDKNFDKFISLALLHQPENFTFEIIVVCIKRNRKYLKMLLESTNKFDLLTPDEKEYLLLL